MHYGFVPALVILIALVSPHPASAQATDVGPFSSCKIGNMIRASVETVYAEGDPNKPIGKLLRGSPLNPVSIECDDTRLFADEVEWREAEPTLEDVFIHLMRGAEDRSVLTEA